MTINGHVIATAEQQHMAQAAIPIHLSQLRCGPGLPQTTKVTGGVTVMIVINIPSDYPFQYRLAPVSYIQCVDIIATTAHGQVEIDMITRIGAAIIRRQNITIAVSIVDPGRHWPIHAIGFLHSTVGRVIPVHFQINEQILRNK